MAIFATKIWQFYSTEMSSAQYTALSVGKLHTCAETTTNMAEAGEGSSTGSPQKMAIAARELDLEPQDPEATQHEHLITEIEESSEGHLSTALR